MMAWCSLCSTPMTGGLPCPTCARRRQYGTLAVAVTTLYETEVASYRGKGGLRTTRVFLADVNAFYLDALDALAAVMQDRHRILQAHRRELRDESRVGQQDARAAYADGYADGVHRGQGESW